MTNEVKGVNPTIDENGLFDIDDEALLSLIAGGASTSAAVLDNHCVTNKSQCGVSK